MIINIYLLFFVVFLYFNNLFLIQPLLYTTLLAPIFVYNHYKLKSIQVIFWYFFFTTPFLLIHSFYVEFKFSYLISYTYLLLVYFQVILFYKVIRENKIKEYFFIKAVYINFFLTVLALFVFFTPFKESLWVVGELSIGQYSRLKMFTYEPSHYSTLLVPLFFYCFFSYLKNNTLKNFFPLFVILFSLILSFSFGTLSSIVLAFVIVLIFKSGYFLKKKTIVLIVLIGFFSSTLILTTDNPFKQRLDNVLTGQDNSASGRVYGSMFVAFEIAHSTNPLFGAGLGQSKHILYGSDLVKEQSWADDQRIINAVADTVATFGYLGLFLRFILEFYFFYKFKVYRNSFSFSLFVWVFIYQFTGSFLTNVVEYFSWVLAFSNIFPRFNFKK